MINYLKNGGKSILQMFDDLGQYCANTYNKVEADNKPKEVLPSLVELTRMLRKKLLMYFTRSFYKIN